MIKCDKTTERQLEDSILNTMCCVILPKVFNIHLPFTRSPLWHITPWPCSGLTLPSSQKHSRAKQQTGVSKGPLTAGINQQKRVLNNSFSSTKAPLWKAESRHTGRGCQPWEGVVAWCPQPLPPQRTARLGCFLQKPCPSQLVAYHPALRLTFLRLMLSLRRWRDLRGKKRRGLQAQPLCAGLPAGYFGSTVPAGARTGAAIPRRAQKGCQETHR